MASYIGRRKFLATLGGAVATWPLAARAEQPALPVVGFIRDGSADATARNVAAFRKGLNETGTCLADPEYTLLDFQEVGGHRSMLGVPLTTA